MGKAGKIIAGIGLIVTGAVVGVFTGNWTLAFVMASSGVGLLTNPRLPKSSSLDQRQAIALDNRIGTQQFFPLVYGTAKFAGVLADVRIDTASTERKRLVMVVAWSHASQDGSGLTAIDEVWFDDRLAISGIALQTPFNNPVDGQKTTQTYLTFQHHLGLTSDTVDARLNQLFPASWPSTSKGLGLCYSRFELWYSNDIYPNGIPNIQAVIRGNRVYDPRDGTWKFSTNPSLCIRDFLTSPVYGCGVPAANVEDQSFIDIANYCDELVTNPFGGVMKRYEVNGWVDTSRSVQENLAELCSSCRGQVINEGDVWRMLVRRQRSLSGYKVDASNTLEGSWQFVLSGNDSSPNIIRANFLNPAANYTADSIQWPDTGGSNPYLDEDNGFENILSIDLPYTQNKGGAQQLLITMLKEARRGIGATCTLKENALSIRVGDLVEVTQDTPGWLNKVFDVVALLLSPDGSVQAILAEYDDAVYDLETQFIPPEPPSATLPNPFSVARPSSLVLVSEGQAQLQNDGGYVPRIRATWTKPSDPFVDYYEVQARKLLSTDVVDVAAPFVGANFSSSGVAVASITRVWDDDTSANAFHTDTAVAGAYVRLDCGSAITKEYIQLKFFLSTAVTTACNWTVQYSDNGTTWATAASNFQPGSIGWNVITWANVGAHRFWGIILTNVPGSGPYVNEMEFKEGAWDQFGRVPGTDAPLCYIYPVSVETWQVRVRSVNKIGVSSSWREGQHAVVVPDPRPQITSITLTTAHSDTHSDIPHQDVAHGDAPHTDAHSDLAHNDHTDHNDVHSDSGSHDDVAHDDSHSDIGLIDTDHTDTHGDSAHGDHSDGHSDSHVDNNHQDTAHDDSHGDVGLIDTDHTDSHSDNIHADHTDTSFSHTDVAHIDTHTDTGHADAPHSDAHTDAHSDGQHGVGVALQADSDSASVKAVARKVSSNLLQNGGGETGTLGSQATNWTYVTGQNLVVANDAVHGGSRSLKIGNPSLAQSYSIQSISLTAGKRYRLEGWLKQGALGGSGGVVLDMQAAHAITVVESSAPFTDFTGSTVVKVIGINGVAAVDWTYVYLRFIPTVSETFNLYLLLGYQGTTDGTCWFDDVGIFEDEPYIEDVRAQPAYDGRNVSIELIDAATGAQILLNPGDQVRIGAVAYSLKGGAGVEGPVGYGSAGLFNVAPVGTDLWVPN